MPTYEYACRSCEERIEVVQSFSDAALTVCESCGGELRKVFSAAGLIFKGSGWHIKDYSSNARSSSTPSGAATSDSGGTGTSGDTGTTTTKDSAASSSTPTSSGSTSD